MNFFPFFHPVFNCHLIVSGWPRSDAEECQREDQEVGVKGRQHLQQVTKARSHVKVLRRQNLERHLYSSQGNWGKTNFKLTACMEIIYSLFTVCQKCRKNNNNICIISVHRIFFWLIFSDAIFHTQTFKSPSPFLKGIIVYWNLLIKLKGEYDRPKNFSITKLKFDNSIINYPLCSLSHWNTKLRWITFF